MESEREEAQPGGPQEAPRPPKGGAAEEGLGDLGGELTQEQKDAATAGIDRQIKSVEDFLAANPVESEADKAKRERREKSKRIISAVSDGLSALGNLFFTSQYAPSMYSAQSGSATKATRESIERARADREKRRDAYMNFSLKLGGLEAEKARTLRELEARHEARQAALAKAKHDQEIRPYQLAKAQSDAQTAQTKAEYEPRQQEAELATKNARTQAQEASAAASRASATASYARAGENAHHFMGKTYYSDKDYEKDVTAAAKAYNERIGEWVDKPNSNGSTTRVFVPKEGKHFIETEDKVGSYGDRRKRAPEEYAGELEKLLREEAEEQRKARQAQKKTSSTPSGGGKKSPTAPTTDGNGKKSPTA